jgi:hypothetical protein
LSDEIIDSLGDIAPLLIQVPHFLFQQSNTSVARLEITPQTGLRQTERALTIHESAYCAL